MGREAWVILLTYVGFIVQLCAVTVTPTHNGSEHAHAEGERLACRPTNTDIPKH